MRRGRVAVAVVERSAFAGFRSPPPEVITLAVSWYMRYGLSYRDVGELLAGRGVDVDHVSALWWCSGSRRCWQRLLGRAGMRPVIVGASMGVG